MGLTRSTSAEKEMTYPPADCHGNRKCSQNSIKISCRPSGGYHCHVRRPGDQLRELPRLQSSHCVLSEVHLLHWCPGPVVQSMATHETLSPANLGTGFSHPCHLGGFPKSINLKFEMCICIWWALSLSLLYINCYYFWCYYVKPENTTTVERSERVQLIEPVFANRKWRKPFIAAGTLLVTPSGR